MYGGMGWGRTVLVCIHFNSDVILLFHFGDRLYKEPHVILP